MPLTPRHQPVLSTDDVCDFRRAAACQLTNDPGTNMTMDKYSDEQQHFYTAIHKTLEAASNNLSHEGKEVLERFSNNEDVEITADGWQLENSGNTHEARNHWRRISGSEWCSPVGEGYTLLQPAKQNLTVKVRTPDLSISIVKSVKREMIIPSDTPPKTLCLRLQIGEEIIQLADKELIKPFEISSWRPPPDENETPIDNTDNSTVTQHTFAVKLVSNGVVGQQYCICKMVPASTRKDDITWIPLATVWIEKVLGQYKFSMRGKQPYCKLLLGYTHNINGETDYNLDGDEDCFPDDARNIYMTVFINYEDIYYKGVGCVLTGIHPNFKTLNEKFTPAMFSTLVHSLTPLNCTQKVVYNFGRQPNETGGVTRTMFFGNCAYENGIVYQHKETKYSLIDEVFTSDDNSGKSNMLPSQYPNLTIIRQHHVRFFILWKLWRDVLPNIALRNEESAKNAFAASVSDLFYNEMIKGGPNNASPARILYSSDGYTGKSYILKLINRFYGFPLILKTGYNNTEAAISHAMSWFYADLCYAMDEIMTQNNAKEDNAKLKKIVHMSYQGNIRQVCGKLSETCRSQICGTSNVLPNTNDGAFQGRLLIFHFMRNEKLVDAYYKKQFLASLHLISALQPDFENLRYNGELDIAAIQDCASFLGQAAETSQSRSADMWAYCLYFRLLIEVMTLATPEQLRKTVQSVTEQAINAEIATSSVNNMFIDFLKKVKETKANSNTMNTNAMQVIYLHNMRTNAAPPAWSGEWIGLRLQMLVTILNRQYHTQFTARDIKKIAQTYRNDITFASAEFYDLQHGWPMKNPMNPAVVLTEDDEYPKVTDQAMWIKKSLYVSITSDKEVGSAASEHSLRQIIIDSHNDEEEPYNFYDKVTDLSQENGWFGWRALGNSDFLSMFGGNNALKDEYNPGNSINRKFQQMHIEQNFEPISKCFDFEYLKTKYNKKSFDPDDPKLPPCLKKDCFVYRNDPGDRFQPDDDDDSQPSPDQAPELPNGDDGEISRPQMHSCIRTTPSSNPDGGEAPDEDAMEDARGENLMDSDGESEVSL